MSDEDSIRGLERLSKLDRLLHEPSRLLIMAHLYVLETADFLFLLRRTGLTKGNLSSHVRKLEEAGLLDVEKKFVDRYPVTAFRLTAEGREAFGRYRETIVEVLGDLDG